MANKVRWGILSTANIGVRKVIPSMQRGTLCDIVAIASRNMDKARAAAAELGSAKAYGSYVELLADPAIDATYNPLPNHLHLPWTVRAMEAGKHVLCEKPLTLDAAECRALIAARDRTGVLVGEAFMVHTHPQWRRVRELIVAGEIGPLHAIAGAFCYYNDDPANVRNVAGYGGGGLYDIGCYLIHTSRLALGRAPLRVQALVDRDPRFGVDRLASFLLDFGDVHGVYTCSMRLANHQRVTLLGETGRIEVEIPFNAPLDEPTRLIVSTTTSSGGDLFGLRHRVEEIAACNQYTIQGDLFSRAILEGGNVPVPLEDAFVNMASLDAAFRSERSGQWEIVEKL
jgi:predicted dehydrogenase